MPARASQATVEIVETVGARVKVSHSVVEVLTENPSDVASAAAQSGIPLDFSIPTQIHAPNNDGIASNVLGEFIQTQAGDVVVEVTGAVSNSGDIRVFNPRTLTTLTATGAVGTKTFAITAANLGKWYIASRSYVAGKTGAGTFSYFGPPPPADAGVSQACVEVLMTPPSRAKASLTAVEILMSGQGFVIPSQTRTKTFGYAT